MNIQIYRGDTAEFAIYCKRGTSRADITGGKLYFTVKSSIQDSDTSALIKKDSAGNGITIITPTLGKAKLQLLPSDTDTLSIGTYVYDVQLKTSDGEIHTLFSGGFELLADVTRRTT